MSGTDSPWKVYTRLLGFARPYRGLLLLAGVGMLLEAGAGGAFAKLMESVVDETFIKRDEAKSLLLPAYIVGLFVIRGVAGYITDMGMGKAARSIAISVSRCWASTCGCPACASTPNPSRRCSCAWDRTAIRWRRRPWTR